MTLLCDTLVTLDARGFLREERPWSSDKRSGEERREKRWENLWLPKTVNWPYCANRFELGSRCDPASWLEEPYSKLWLAVVNWQVLCCYWLLVNWSHDLDYHMIVRFTSPATRGFLWLLSSRWKKSSGTRGFFWREERRKRKWREKTSGSGWFESHYHAMMGVNQHHEIN